MKYFRSSFLLALLVSVAPVLSYAAVSVSIIVAPPELPIYEQPMLPGDGYIWTPGYWAYDDGDYYWVPGTWILPPRVGLLWTPGYWIWSDNFYVFHYGYWGRRVGYYGGVNYGYGYGGYGYDGGRWDRGRFSYNRSANNINVTNVHNTYTKIVVNNSDNNHASYNGGNGGTRARPSSEDRTGDKEQHVAPTAEQTRHQQTARAKPELRQSANQGRPPIAATSKPAKLEDRSVVPARGDDGNGDRANTRKAPAPSAVPRSDPVQNTNDAGARANANVRRGQRQQPVLMNQPNVQAQPQQDQPRQQRFEPQQQRQQTEPQIKSKLPAQPHEHSQQQPEQRQKPDAQPEQQQERPQQEERPQRQERGRPQRERQNQRE